MSMTTTPYCPYCGDELESQEMFEQYRYAETECVAFWLGRCNSCNRNFTWRERFTLTSIDSVTDISGS